MFVGSVPAARTRRTEKKAESLARQILDDIFASDVGPGETLPPEAAMLGRYRVGRTTLREALRILEVHGLLMIRTGPGGGPIVTPANGRNYGRTSSLFYRAAGVRLHHLLEARVVMEPIAARLAAEHQPPEAVARLRQIVADLEHDATGDNRAFLTASRDFHDVVNGMSGNPIFDLFCQGLVDMFIDRLAGYVYPPSERDNVTRQHLAVAKAILRGNGAQAERLMRQHMNDYSRFSWDGWKGGLTEVITWR